MKIGITETILRDANQSLVATRMPLDSFEPILNRMDKAGYYSIECWGGAVFDSCLRYLNEDPWERLKIIRKHMPNSKLQMLLRGQSLLGYRHYSDDVVRKFIFNSVEKGIDIIRIFDALNDIKNIEVAVEETLRCGAEPSCAISYTVSPVHDIDGYLSLAKSMESIGASSICIKDMSGILTPDIAFELISRLKSTVKLPIVLHSHCTTGMAYMSYLKAIEAGVDVIDTAVSSFSGGTSQPATEVMIKVIQDHHNECHVNTQVVKEINEHFSKVKKDFIDSGILDTRVLECIPTTLIDQIPGGMYSNLISQMKNEDILDRFDEVLEEIPQVRKDLGFPPLVTPISQMVGTQSIMNVLTGKRYQTVIKETHNYFLGEYGRPPGKVNEELMIRLVGQKEFAKKRLSKEMEPQYKLTKEKYADKNYGRSDLLSLILFPELTREFIKKRDSDNLYLGIYKVKKVEQVESVKKYKKIDVEDKLKAVLIAIMSNYLDKPVSNIDLDEIYVMR